MRRVRADLSGRPRGTRSVVLAHAFVAGAQPSDSERDISVGGVSLVPTSVFAGIDYIALGHLHGRHTLTDAVRYSGSPLAYSFSEAGPRQGLLAGRPRRRRARPRRVRRGAGPAPARAAHRRARGPPARPRPGPARAVLGAGDAHRRRAAAPGDGAAAAPLPAHPGDRLRGHPRRSRLAAVGAHPGPQRPRHRRRLRARPARGARHPGRVQAVARGERRLLRGPRRRHLPVRRAVGERGAV